VHLHDALHQCQADAEAALRAIERARTLREELEDVWQQVRSDTHAGIADTQQNHLPLRLGFEPDVTALRGVLRRVDEQIREHL